MSSRSWQLATPPRVKQISGGNMYIRTRTRGCCNMFGKQWVATCETRNKPIACVGTAQCSSAGGFARTGLTEPSGLQPPGTHPQGSASGTPGLEDLGPFFLKAGAAMLPKITKTACLTPTFFRILDLSVATLPKTAIWTMMRRPVLQQKKVFGNIAS